jgi:hypothetical protein
LLKALTPTEVAVLEVLRSGPSVMETSWERFGDAVTGFVEQGEIRPGTLNAEIADEPHRQARTRWAEVCRMYPTLAATE